MGPYITSASLCPGHYSSCSSHGDKSVGYTIPLTSHTLALSRRGLQKNKGRLQVEMKMAVFWGVVPCNLEDTD